MGRLTERWVAPKILASPAMAGTQFGGKELAWGGNSKTRVRRPPIHFGHSGSRTLLPIAQASGPGPITWLDPTTWLLPLPEFFSFFSGRINNLGQLSSHDGLKNAGFTIPQQVNIRRQNP